VFIFGVVVLRMVYLRPQECQFEVEVLTVVEGARRVIVISHRSVWVRLTGKVSETRMTAGEFIDVFYDLVVELLADEAT
jgi:hypothetical protein